MSTKELEKTNSPKSVCFVNESLIAFLLQIYYRLTKFFFSSQMRQRMTKAAANLKMFYKNLIQVTCLAHGKNKVKKYVRGQFPLLILFHFDRKKYPTKHEFKYTR